MVLQQACYAVMDGFLDMPTSEQAQKTRSSFLDVLASIISFFIVLAIVSLAGKWLWNESVVQLVSVAKPAKSAYQILGLFIFWSLFR